LQTIAAIVYIDITNIKNYYMLKKIKF